MDGTSAQGFGVAPVPLGTSANPTTRIPIEMIRQQALEEAARLFEAGALWRDVVARTGLSRRTVFRLQKTVRRAQAEAERARAAETRATHEALQQRVVELHQEAERLRKCPAPMVVTSRRLTPGLRGGPPVDADRLTRLRAELDAVTRRERRKDQELRDIRKGERWQTEAMDLGYHLSDVLPDSVWRLLQCHYSVPVTFQHREVISAERHTVLKLSDEAAEKFRLYLAVRRGQRMDEVGIAEGRDAERKRFARLVRCELYGEEE